MKYLYHDEEGNAIVSINQELLELLTPQNSRSIMTQNQELRIHEHVSKFREIYPKYCAIREHFSKLFSTIMGN